MKIDQFKWLCGEENTTKYCSATRVSSGKVNAYYSDGGVTR